MISCSQHYNFYFFLYSKIAQLLFSDISDEEDQSNRQTNRQKKRKTVDHSSSGSSVPSGTAVVISSSSSDDDLEVVPQSGDVNKLVVSTQFHSLIFKNLEILILENLFTRLWG